MYSYGNLQVTYRLVPLCSTPACSCCFSAKSKSFIFGAEQCVIESLDIYVGECISTLHRTVVHTWKDGISCEGGLALPSDSRVSCGECLVSVVQDGGGDGPPFVVFSRSVPARLLRLQDFLDSCHPSISGSECCTATLQNPPCRGSHRQRLSLSDEMVSPVTSYKVEALFADVGRHEGRELRSRLNVCNRMHMRVLLLRTW